jgi:hypothetical protein
MCMTLLVDGEGEGKMDVNGRRKWRLKVKGK